MKPYFTPKEPTSEQQVADKLREHILTGTLPVGEFLSQRKLAELTGTSVISVRGARRQRKNRRSRKNHSAPHPDRPRERTGRAITTFRSGHRIGALIGNYHTKSICRQLYGNAFRFADRLSSSGPFQSAGLYVVAH